MKKVLILGLFCMFSLMGLVSEAQAQRVGPLITAADPEAGITADLIGFPRWLRDGRGIQLSICDQVPITAEAPPCPSFTLANPLAVPPEAFEAMYYATTANICNDPAECFNSTPNGEDFLISFFIEAAAAEDPADPEAVPLISNGVLIRLRGLVFDGPYRVITPWGNFGPFRPNRPNEIRQVISLDAPAPFTTVMNGRVKRFRSNTTAARADAAAGIPAFPGFIGNGVTLAPLKGPGGTQVRVIGPPGSGINVATNRWSVEGKLFTTPTAQAGGLVVERSSMTSGPGARGVLFVRTNVPGGSIQITSIAGVNSNRRMIADTANPGRFFTTFPMGNFGPAQTEIGMAMTVLDAAGNPVADLQDIPTVMQDTVTSTGAVFNARTGVLRVNAVSSLPGARGAPGAILTVQEVDALGNQVGADLGRIDPNNGLLILRNVAAPPALVRIQSSLGGSVTVSVRGATATDTVTITGATYNRGTGILTVNARSNVTARPGRPAPTLTVEGIDPQGILPATDLGTINILGRRVLRGLSAPPSFVRVSSTLGGTMTAPVAIQ